MTDPQNSPQAVRALQASRRDWPSLREASAQFGISRDRLRRLLQEDQVQGIRRGIGRYWHVDPASLAQWMAQQPHADPLPDGTDPRVIELLELAHVEGFELPYPASVIALLEKLHG